MDWHKYKERVMAAIEEYADMPVTPHTAESMHTLIAAWDDACVKAGYSGEHAAAREAGFEEWAERLQNADGTHGPHWTKDQTEAVRRSNGINAEPDLFWMAINAIYSDFCRVMQRYGLDKPSAYADFAVAFWFEDADAVENKLSEYWEHIVHH